MADEQKHEEAAAESMVERVLEKINGHDSSSASDAEDEKKEPLASVKEKVYRLFGRQKPVHRVLGGGKPADIFLWRNKKASAGVLVGATAAWVLFELVEYHLVTLVCHLLILGLAILFIWSNASSFIYKTRPKIPEVHIPEEPILQLASAVRVEINRALSCLHDLASGKDLKKFLSVIAGLWVLSIVGSRCNFLTLSYIAFLVLFTLPLFYEKYDDKVDSFAERAVAEVKKHYAAFDAKVLSKVPKTLKGMKKD